MQPNLDKIIDELEKQQQEELLDKVKFIKKYVSAIDDCTKNDTSSDSKLEKFLNILNHSHMGLNSTDEVGDICTIFGSSKDFNESFLSNIQQQIISFPEVKSIVGLLNDFLEKYYFLDIVEIYGLTHYIALIELPSTAEESTYTEWKDCTQWSEIDNGLLLAMKRDIKLKMEESQMQEITSKNESDDDFEERKRYSDITTILKKYKWSLDQSDIVELCYSLISSDIVTSNDKVRKGSNPISFNDILKLFCFIFNVQINNGDQLWQGIKNRQLQPLKLTTTLSKQVDLATRAKLLEKLMIALDKKIEDEM